MSRIDYPASSPYAFTPQTDWHIGFYVNRVIPKSVDDILMEIQTRYEYRPDRLSNDLYSTPAYWWIFLKRNPNVIRDPIWDFKAGIMIYAPSAGSLNTIIGG